MVSRSTRSGFAGRPTLLAATLTSVCLMGASSSASAASILASVAWALGGVPGATSPDVDGPATSGFVDVLASDSDVAGNNIFYHTYGDVSGNFGSRVSGGGDFDITGTFSFDESYVATSPNPMFSFTIIPGEIGTSLGIDPGTTMPYVPGMSEELVAGYTIDILLNGSSIWSSEAEIVTNSTGSTCTQMGVDISPGAPSPCGAGTTNYPIGSFSDTLPLGPVMIGDPLDIRYELVTYARGNLPLTCSGGFNGEIGQEGFNARVIEDGENGNGSGACGTAIARSGDPFDLGPNPPGSMTTVIGASAVPEPTTLLLAGAGLLGLGARRRRG